MATGGNSSSSLTSDSGNNNNSNSSNQHINANQNAHRNNNNNYNSANIEGNEAQQEEEHGACSLDAAETDAMCSAATGSDAETTDISLPAQYNLRAQSQWPYRFNQRCGHGITLSNGYRTATRSIRDFSHALVFSSIPLMDDVLFEVIIKKKNRAWDGSIEIGVVMEDPEHFNIPSYASVMGNGVWIMSGTHVRRDAHRIKNDYCSDLNKLKEMDRVGVLCTSSNELVFYVNGQPQGLAACNMPRPLWAIIDLSGRCVQVSLCPSDAAGENPNSVLSLLQQRYNAAENTFSDTSDTASLGNTSSSNSNSNGFLSSSSNNLTVIFSNAAKNSLKVLAALPEQGSASSSSSSSSNGRCSSNENTMYKNITNPFAAASVDHLDINDRLRFHARCGSLVKLSSNLRSAERCRPLDEFNNGVVMTHRPLKDNELFEIRIDKLVDKWSGSIEVGVTTHNPNTLFFPATMTNMRSGTFMMSGSGILANGKGTRRQYGEFNLDELREGDRVGMMRTSNGNLHYYINGQDQGVAASRILPTVWGVIDLYGMTIKVTIVDRDERESQNLVTRRNNFAIPSTIGATALNIDGLGVGCSNTAIPLPLVNLATPGLDASLPSTSSVALTSSVEGIEDRNDDRLTFHPICGTHAMVSRNGRRAYRPNAADDFNNGVVLTRRPLRPNELFQVRLDSVISKWAGSVEMGVTTFSADELDFPFTMTNVRSGTWMMTGNGVMHNGVTVFEQYGQNLDRLQVGDRVGVMRKDDGTLNFWVNGVDQGPAAHNVPENVYGVIDLYGQAAQASIVDSSECGSPDTGGNSTISNTTLYSEPPLRFHSIHGKNAGISNAGLTATRPNSLAEFNEAVVFSSRPLRQRELFEVVLESVVHHWSGNIEIGVISTRPEELLVAANATDLKASETIILCGSTIFHNRKTIRSNTMDLDTLGIGARVGVMRIGDAIHFFVDGIDQGATVDCRATNIWGVVDLYGQCAQVSLTQQQPDIRAPYATSENSQSCQATSVIQPTNLETKHRWTLVPGNVQLSQNWTVATRVTANTSTLSRCIFSEPPLTVGSPFEIKILIQNPMFAGCLSIGVTDLNITDNYVRKNSPLGIKSIPANVWYVTGNEVCYNSKLLHRCMVSLDWLRVNDRIALELTPARTLRLLINSEDMHVEFPTIPNVNDVYVVVELGGATGAVQVISAQVPNSPLRPYSLRLQDSLDFGADSLNKQDSMLESIESENFEFSENLHGKNVSLLENHKIAMRTNSYYQGLVFVTKPLCRGDSISIKIEAINNKWKGSIGLGVIGHCPQTFLSNNSAPIPSNIMHCRAPCWVVTEDFININGQHIESKCGEALKHIEAGNFITMSLTHSGVLTISIISTCTNNLEELGTNLPNHVYPVFDLYGNCEKISIVSNNEAAQQNGTPVVEEASLELDNSMVAGVPKRNMQAVVKEVVAEIVEAAKEQLNLENLINAATETNTTLQQAQTNSTENVAQRQQDEMAASVASITTTPTTISATNTTTTRPQTPVAPRPAQRLVEYDTRYGRAEKATFDLPEKDVIETLRFEFPKLPRVVGTPFFAMNRSVMENLEENLLKNLTIKQRDSEQQHVDTTQTGVATTSSACCLQMQHNTNLNIQRSQSTQRFTNSFNALVSAASGIALLSPTTEITATTSAISTTFTDLLAVNTTTSHEHAMMSPRPRLSQSSNDLAFLPATRTMETTLPTVTMATPITSTANANLMPATNSTQSLLRRPIVSATVRSVIDSNRETYECAQLNADETPVEVHMTDTGPVAVRGNRELEYQHIVRIRDDNEVMEHMDNLANMENEYLFELSSAGLTASDFRIYTETAGVEYVDEIDVDLHAADTVNCDNNYEQESLVGVERVDEDQEKNTACDNETDDDDDVDDNETNDNVEKTNEHNFDDDDSDSDSEFNCNAAQQQQQQQHTNIEHEADNNDVNFEHDDNQDYGNNDDQQDQHANDVDVAADINSILSEEQEFVATHNRTYEHLVNTLEQAQRKTVNNVNSQQIRSAATEHENGQEKNVSDEIETENKQTHNVNQELRHIYLKPEELEDRHILELLNPADDIIIERDEEDLIVLEGLRNSFDRRHSNTEQYRALDQLRRRKDIDVDIADNTSSSSSSSLSSVQELQVQKHRSEQQEAQHMQAQLHATQLAEQQEQVVHKLLQYEDFSVLDFNLPAAADSLTEQQTQFSVDNDIAIANVAEEEEATAGNTVEEEAILDVSAMQADKDFAAALKLTLNVTNEEYEHLGQDLQSGHTANCNYYQQALQFCETLVLPSLYFDMNTPVVCYGHCCYAAQNKQLRDWTYFKLNSSVVNQCAHTTMQQLESCNSDWLPLYYIASVDNVRKILDLGRLLPSAHAQLPAEATKQEPSKRIELFSSPNAQTVLNASSNSSYIMLESQQYCVSTAFEVYVRKQELQLSKTRNLAVKPLTVAAELQRMQQDLSALLSNIYDLERTHNLCTKQQVTDIIQTPDVTETAAALCGISTTDIDIEQETVDLTAVEVAEVEESTARSLELTEANAEFTDSAANNEHIWFTQNTDACVITALLLKLEPQLGTAALKTAAAPSTALDGVNMHSKSDVTQFILSRGRSRRCASGQRRLERLANTPNRRSSSTRETVFEQSSHSTSAKRRQQQRRRR